MMFYVQFICFCGKIWKGEDLEGGDSEKTVSIEWAEP